MQQSTQHDRLIRTKPGWCRRPHHQGQPRHLHGMHNGTGMMRTKLVEKLQCGAQRRGPHAGAEGAGIGQAEGGCG